MTVYADYDFYLQMYLCDREAVIAPALFPHYARRAGNYIRQYTFGNIGEEIPESVKLCCCELAEMLYRADNAKAAQGVSSEKVGDLSMSYESAESHRQALPKTIKSVIYAWLADTGLLCTGGKLLC